MRIAVTQLTCVPARPAENAATMADLAGRARSEGAALVVFPELVLTGYELAALAADPALWVRDADDPRLDPVRSAGIASVVNLARRDADDRPLLASFVFGADGSLITSYAKRHLYEAEREVFVPGGHDGRFTLDGVPFSLGTCFDNHHAGVTDRAAADGARVHLASSLYGLVSGEAERVSVHPGAARRTGLVVALANHVGPAGAWTGCGGAAVWGPDGRVLAEGDARTPSAVVADLSPLL
ncbi:carbon-nitrogen hydrolase family protein [Streptomyces sp. BI20]|uniref:carbon-nitrogen hydrolase family protein n=1 Tax=Streptomyces sp. BI20 TaxID=3403460 RepID=UPI003C7380AB